MSTTKPGMAVPQTVRPTGSAGPTSVKADSLTALLGAGLAGLGALVVLTVGLWLTETRPESGSWSGLFVAAFFFLIVVAVGQVQKWIAVGQLSVHWGWVGLGLFLSGAGAFIIVATALTAAGSPEWVVGEVGLICLLLCFAGVLCALAAIPDRKSPGAGSGYSERVLRGSLAAPGNLPPTEDEEAVLEQALADFFGHRSGGSFLVLPTVVRQAELVLPVDLAAATQRGRQAFAGADAVSVGDWASESQTVLRGWWQSGVRINGCPVVVTLWFTPADAQTTRTTVRAASKVWMANKHIAENALSQIVAELGPSTSAPQPVR